MAKLPDIFIRNPTTDRSRNGYATAPISSLLDTNIDINNISFETEQGVNIPYQIVDIDTADTKKKQISFWIDVPIQQSSRLKLVIKDKSDNSLSPDTNLKTSKDFLNNEIDNPDMFHGVRLENSKVNILISCLPDRKQSPPYRKFRLIGSQ
ncbi:MAG: hypothetical protein WCH01_20090 [Methylococcaceae bacterium]